MKKAYLLFLLLLTSPYLKSENLEYTADLGVVSDYIFRGVSISDEQPVLQGAFYIKNDKGWSYRFFASSYDFNGDTDTKGEFSLDYQGDLKGEFSWDMGITKYVYESDNDSASVEWYFGISAYNFSARYFKNEDTDYEYAQYGYQWAYSDELLFKAHYGINRQSYLKETADDYSVSAHYQWNKALNIYLTLGEQNRTDSFAFVGANYQFNF